MTDTRARHEYRYCLHCLNHTRDARTYFCDECISAGRMYWTTNDIERVNHDAGYHFFDRDTKRFFKSRTLAGTYQGHGVTYFVTSERYESDGSPRAYTVRRANPDGSIDTEGEFQQFATANAARAYAKKLAQS